MRRGSYGGRYWRVVTEDGATLALESNVAPRFAVRCSYETEQLKVDGEIRGLGRVLVADKSKPKVEQATYGLFERRSDAKAAAENSAPHIGAIPSPRVRRRIAWSPIAGRSVMKITEAVEIDRVSHRELVRELNRKVRRELALEQSYSYSGVGSKKRVEKNVAQDAQMRARGLDAQRRKARWL